MARQRSRVENAVEHAVSLGDGVIYPEHLPERVAASIRAACGVKASFRRLR